MRRVGFTGTQAGMVEPQSCSLQDWFGGRERSEMQHGDCVGADAQAHQLLLDFDWRIVIRPGDGPRHLRAFCTGYDVLHPPRPYLARNTDIVLETQELVACPKGLEELRSGTWSTVRTARKMQRLITIIWPDGSRSYEIPKKGAEDLV